ncbi:aspartate/glutamate racemase [Zobellella endophytica]|uniref:Aspartate/glutamate racemase n=1 Tax=Zobellella endophytica TaxID=2116700 RepID=A0A2P7RBK6_9GAMM|nr:aspartate/glutamate racemase family protein [Zobellella endophytica]PSJ47542.1 aspartate/glutamate racemase [Zobellella endophytica]
MKTIGLLGGMSWESTGHYYSLLNEGVRQARGGLHSAPIAMVSVDFAPLAAWMKDGDWDAIRRHLTAKARQVEAAGADFLLLGTNTMHKVADDIAAAIDIPLLHLIDATAAAVKARGIDSVGLLGTRTTMTDPFYADRLRAHGLEVRLPGPAARDKLDRIIFEELCLGRFTDASRRELLYMMADLRQAGAQGIVEGCTEIGMLVEPSHTRMPLFDTTRIHARAAVRTALGD